MGIEAITRALEASLEAGSMKAFYSIVDMRNPSRSYFVRFGGRLHSLKAVVAHALREDRSKTMARDFHAVDAANRLNALRFDIVHSNCDEDAERERVWITRLSRAGQIKFRANLIDLYGRCPLSGCTTPTALEAAHVKSVSAQGTDLVSNGILLRADLHKLFDANLIAINPFDGRVEVSTECKADYSNLLRKVVFCAPSGGPSLSDFKERWKMFQSAAADTE
ncbi:MAG: HNH endonuclease signature motif containing protein [Sphingomonas sp.]